MKIKNLLIVLVLALAIYSCGSDSDAPFDAEKQAIIDDELLIDYLKSHYLIEEDGALGTIRNGETPLFSNIKSLDVKKNDIDYKLYYIILNEGVGAQATKFDSVLVDISGIRIDSTYFQFETLDFRADLTDILYKGGAAGFSYGTSLLKEGSKVINNDESFYFENSGEGIFFLPSGLGYGNASAFNTGGIEENTPLIFKIKLNATKQSDNDNDGILNKDEDTNNDDDLSNDDTDNDGIPNYLDKDN